MVEYERIVSPYEFEERANFFMSEVIDLSKNFADLLVEAENKTLGDLESNSWVIKKSAKSKKPEMNYRAFLRGIEMDIRSTNETVVMITIHGRRKRSVERFEALSNKSAKHFQGISKGDGDIKLFDGPEDEFRYFSCLTYLFR